jgi:hypothetical protein
MLGFFTDPLTDEPLYSSAARYSDRLPYPNRECAAERIFGSVSAAAVDFPTGLDHLISVLPKGHLYTSDRFIDNNTHYPYFAPFVPTERAKVLRQEMCIGTANHIQARLGIKAGKLKPPKQLRFCPECVADDKKAGHETYWRRLHQLTGVEVCPNHLLFLESSSVPFGNRERRGTLISAERGVFEKAPRPLDSSDRYNILRLKIAENSQWLLGWHGPYPGSEVLRDRYYNHLLRRGLAYYNGRIRTTKLIKAFNEFYPSEFLSELQCSLGEHRMNWLLRLVSPSKSMVAQHPLYHILLMVFLGCTAEELFTKYEEFKPFGDGPWPCLNKAAAHYKELTVRECRVTDSCDKKKRGRPRGDFFCDCGFAYKRTGPDESEDDRYRFESVTSYGHIWERTFEEQWYSASITKEEMAESFGVIQFTLTRHAIRLGLNLKRECRGSRPTTEPVISRYSKTRQTLISAKERYRTEWLSLLKRYPKAGRRRLQNIAYYTWWWLNRDDPEWLEEHSPPSKTPLPPPVRLDWKRIDIELSTKAKAAALSIKKADGRPVRVSKAAIIARVGHRGWLEKDLDKLPRTAKVFESHLETYEECAVRQLYWAADQFSAEGRIPTRFQLIARAGVKNKAGKSAIVQREVNSILKQF